MDVKHEEEDEPPVLLGPAALGLQPVGARPPPRPSPAPGLTHQKLNARGMPARIRKKNRLFFDEDAAGAPPPPPPPPHRPAKSPRSPRSVPASPSPRSPRVASRPVTPKKPKSAPAKSSPAAAPVPTPAPAPDPAVGRRMGMRLRNLLKLPKAHRWVCFEYFYSDIDRALFAGENDFLICLKESFPRLGSRELTRVQWRKIRRMMGKPRRCSRAFFAEERKDLERKRRRIRVLQQRKGGSVFYKDLPAEIPLQLTVGTRVTARLRTPQDGLFTGKVDAFDTSNDMYRITFDRPGLGTHSVPDVEVLADEPQETLEVSGLTARAKRVKCGVPDLMARYRHAKEEPAKERVYPYAHSHHYPYPLPDVGVGLDEEFTVGDYPARPLERIIRITKILNAKRNRIRKLRELNAETERRRSFGERAPPEFERKYAAVVIELEKMNGDLREHLAEVRGFCHELAPGLSVAAMLVPSYLRDKCRQEATALVADRGGGAVRSATALDLIADLTALLLQIKSVSDSEENGYELKVLRGTVERIKSKLEPDDRGLFENRVEIHVQRILMGLGSTGSAPAID